MNAKKKKMFRISVISVVLLISLWLLKDFNLSWVEVNTDHAKVTINFLFPMDKDKLSDCITLSHQLPYANQFDYAVEWLTNSVVCIRIKEQNLIKGQKVQLIIKNAPSQLSFISRNASVAVQFTTEVALLEPADDLLIATERPFIVRFNTPMNKNKLNKFLQSDTTFYIEPCVVQNNAGKKIEDLSTFIFTPKMPLENGQRYLLSFRKGMPSQSGALLKQDVSIILTTDTKPIIAATYPENNNKWIGLYPRLKLETDSPVTAGYLTLNNETIQGKMIDPYHIEFLPSQVLEPNMVYKAVFKVQSASGEFSEPKEIIFTTVRIDADRIWMEVFVHNKSQVTVFQGNKPIRTMICSVSKDAEHIPLGTYYIRDKGESFVDSKNREGANFWLKITDTCFIQGLIRDEYWNIKQHFLNQLGQSISRNNVILKDEDARWLYDNIPSDTMVIIHK